jgi:low affinity Fe/Cu permease
LFGCDRTPVNDEKPRAPSWLMRRFAPVAGRIAGVTGHPMTFILSSAAIALWVVATVAFHLARSWQTPVNTVITIVTFLMVFLIQSTQNRDAAAVQAKLDELIRAHGPANNEFIGIENRTINEVHELRQETAIEVKKLDELISAVEREHDDAPTPPTEETQTAPPFDPQRPGFASDRVEAGELRLRRDATP